MALLNLPSAHSVGQTHFQHGTSKHMTITHWRSNPLPALGSQSRGQQHCCAYLLPGPWGQPTSEAQDNSYTPVTTLRLMCGVNPLLKHRITVNTPVITLCLMCGVNPLLRERMTALLCPECGSDPCQSMNWYVQAEDDITLVPTLSKV